MISPLILEDDISGLEKLASSKFDQAARELIGNYEYTKLLAEGKTQPSEILPAMRKLLREAKASQRANPFLLGQDAASQSNS